MHLPFLPVIDLSFLFRAPDLYRFVLGMFWVIIRFTFQISYGRYRVFLFYPYLTPNNIFALPLLLNNNLFNISPLHTLPVIALCLILVGQNLLRGI